MAVATGAASLGAGGVDEVLAVTTPSVDTAGGGIGATVGAGDGTGAAWVTVMTEAGAETVTVDGIGGSAIIVEVCVTI